MKLETELTNDDIRDGTYPYWLSFYYTFRGNRTREMLYFEDTASMKLFYDSLRNGYHVGNTKDNNFNFVPWHSITSIHSNIEL